MPAPLPERLHRAVSILSRTGDPGAAEAQSACAEVAARLVRLEEAVLALLRGELGAEARARVLVGEPSDLDMQRTAKVLLDERGEAEAFRYAAERIALLDLAGDDRGVDVWRRVRRALRDLAGQQLPRP